MQEQNRQAEGSGGIANATALFCFAVDRAKLSCGQTHLLLHRQLGVQAVSLVPALACLTGPYRNLLMHAEGKEL